MTELILASGSITRAKMLRSAGVDFTVIKPMADEEGLKETLLAEGLPPRDMADALAEVKARSVSMLKPDAFVLGADQILELSGQVFSKATTLAEAKKTLSALSGHTHQLISAAVVYQNGQAIWRSIDSVKMHMRPISEDFIDMYLGKMADDALWSVGCYQIEGLGSQLFTRIEGSHFTVLGLPLLPLLDFLRRHGILAI
ncbi:Maf family protein [Kordiimonas pumila]|uniref:Nucleoside triphosphate pyrophosphatase n=1 Tax=Kordiimonas pumila TaxID=2161677 RepID=A0ABV7DAM4_9PROT|nr:Maf family nucleotide pyrophosphatase [Kordiimonas pumila]